MSPTIGWLVTCSKLPNLSDPLVNYQFAIEHGHWNSWFTHSKVYDFPYSDVNVCQRVLCVGYWAIEYSCYALSRCENWHLNIRRLIVPAGSRRLLRGPIQRWGISSGMPWPPSLKTQDHGSMMMHQILWLLMSFNVFILQGHIEHFANIPFLHVPGILFSMIFVRKNSSKLIVLYQTSFIRAMYHIGDGHTNSNREF